MKDYKSNVKDYLEDFWLIEDTYKEGDDFVFFPDDEIESYETTLQSITHNDTGFTFTIAVKNFETKEVYTKSYNVQKGDKLDMIILMPNVVCAMPPLRTEVLVEVTDIFAEAVSLKIVGIMDE